MVSAAAMEDRNVVVPVAVTTHIAKRCAFVSLKACCRVFSVKIYESSIELAQSARLVDENLSG